LGVVIFIKLETMTKFRTPGVYVREKKVFGRAIVTNDTAVPIFIGYTQKPITDNTNQSLPTEVPGEKIKKPKKADEEKKPSVQRINSLREYVNKFGGGYYHQDEKEDKIFYLYESIKLYFANDGGACYIVSIGDYTNKKVSQDDLNEGLKELTKIPQGNLVLCPDAVSLSMQEKGTFYEALLTECTPDTAKRGFVNKFAVLDAGTVNKKVEAYADEVALNQISEGNHLLHGAMYHPWVEATVVTRGDIEEGLLSDENLPIFLSSYGKKWGVKPEQLEKKNNSKLTVRQRARMLNKIEAWDELVTFLIKKNNQLPPSGAVAGAFVRSDNQFGIQKAPANISLKKVVKLSSFITDFTQQKFNAPENGKTINCIRSLVNNGIKIWGARTLDCNDLDFRYVNVRRTMSMLENSIKSLMENFVFDDNNERTWLKIRAALSRFLKQMMGRGILYGTSPQDAYDFSIGFGETMDEADINEGIIRVEVKVALIKPAEFIEITFEQKTMEGGTANVEAENAASLN